MTTLTVDVWIDFASPWSRIGLLELDRAIVEFDQSVVIRLHSLRIDPNAPSDYGQTTIEHLSEDLGIDIAKAEQMLEPIVERGASVGLKFNFDIARGGSTFDAHRMLHLARKYDLELDVAQKFFSAHFEEGLLLSDPSVLQRIAQEADLPANEIADLLSTDQFAEEVLADEARTQVLGITHTASFVINDQLAFDGTQPASIMRAELEKVRAPRQD